MSAYYNEIDPYAAQWLRNLISAGHIASGDVDERSIEDVKAIDLVGYTQCHFFAGIGGWSLALRLAGWPDDKEVWTGSCPCQPFSTAGKQRGSEDARHLWPTFFSLIRERKPATVFGEQVAGASGLAWLDHVCADLEDAGYAAAAADLPACSVGAPHQRQRLWWVADSQLHSGIRGGGLNIEPEKFCLDSDLARRVGDSYESRLQGQNDYRQAPQGIQHITPEYGDAFRLEYTKRGGQQGSRGLPLFSSATQDCNEKTDWTNNASWGDPWSDLEWIACHDGKVRPTKSGLSPLADGISGRVGRLRAYGNAIVPQVAATFIKCVMEAA